MIALLFGVLAVLIFLNSPISLALGLASTIAAAVQAKGPLLFLPQKIYTALDSFPLLAVPLFILAGSFLETGGVGRRLVNLANVMVRHFPGGLGMVVVVATMIFSEVSGSSAADAAAIGSVTIPAMLRLGYTPAFATAVVAAAGGAAVLIPPSIAAVIYGWQANTSVGALFAAGFIPGFATALALMMYIYCTARRHTFPIETKATWAETGQAIRESLPALLMPVIILGGIFGGFFTATESAAVAVIYGVMIALFYYKEITWQDLPGILVEAAVTTGIVGLLLGMAAVFGYVLTTLQVPLKLANAIMAVSDSRWVFLVLVNLLLLVAGCFLNATAILVVIVPILLPMAERFGIDFVHFGIMIIANLGIGYVTPPVGTCLYVACSISKEPLERVIRPLVPLLLVMVAMLAVVTFIPEITLFVPRWLYGK
jgi:C4-dicarboxylate transporter DctM subunit